MSTMLRATTITRNALDGGGDVEFSPTIIIRENDGRIVFWRKSAWFLDESVAAEIAINDLRQYLARLMIEASAAGYEKKEFAS